MMHGVRVCRSLLMSMPGTFIVLTLCSLEGLVMYAYYAECDPLKQGIIDNPNQVLRVHYFCMTGTMAIFLQFHDWNNKG